MRRLRAHTASSLALLLLVVSGSMACVDTSARPEGIAPSPGGSGPRIVFDLDAEPLPEIPFPNDLATRLDPTSPTGRRVNVSTQAPTRLERDLREKADRLTGFGTLPTITVSFDGPLDLCEIAKRHHFNDTFADDAIYLIDVTDPSDSEHFGTLVPLDLGRGYYPLVLERTQYFEGDTGGENLLLADHPLPDCGPYRWEYDKNTFYEFDTNTLLIKTTDILRENATYAVVVTTRLRGENGGSVVSPFPWINHVRQNTALAHLEEALAGTGIDLNDVAFTWTFTTQDATGELLDIRRGLYGHGPFAELAERFPVDDYEIVELRDDDAVVPDGNYYIVPREVVVDTLRPFVAQILGNSVDPEPLLSTYQYVDYIVAGKVRGPNFLIDRDGIAKDPVGCDGEPATDAFQCVLGIDGDEDEIFDIDARTGEMVVGEQEVGFWCFIPNEDRRKGDAPFPVAFYGHGYTSARIEALGFAGNHARHGIATCAIDAYGHGIALDPNALPPSLVRAALRSGKIGKLLDVLSPSRARDLNNDGVPDPGGDFWSADLFHTRDIVRQSLIDHMVVLRLLRAMDGKRLGPDMNGDGKPELLGDFNADGRVDLGGPTNQYYAWGQSLGGILSGALAGAEPALTAAAPTSGAGGLMNVGIRSRQGGVVEAVFLRLMGPIFWGQRDENDGGMDLFQIVPDLNHERRVFLGRAPHVEVGDGVRLLNLSNGEVDEGEIRPDGQFRVAVAADAISAPEKRARLGFDVLHVEHPDYGTSLPPVVPDTTALGDRLRLEICEGPCTPDAKMRFVLETFEGGSREGIDGSGQTVKGEYFQGTIYPKGQPLVALHEGLGMKRQTPDLRRLLGLAGFILEAADPAAYARYYFKERDRLKARWAGAEPDLDFGVSVLVVNTVGDMNVPIDTGIAQARFAGYLDTDQMRFLVENGVVEGVERVQAERWGAPILFDADNLSQGTDGFEVDGVPVPRPPPGQELRATFVEPEGVRVHGMRLPYIRPQGEHGFLIPDPTLPFDVHSFMAHQISHFFASGGTDLRDDLCMQDGSCDWMPQ